MLCSWSRWLLRSGHDELLSLHKSGTEKNIKLLEKFLKIVLAWINRSSVSCKIRLSVTNTFIRSVYIWYLKTERGNITPSTDPTYLTLQFSVEDKRWAWAWGLRAVPVSSWLSVQLSEGKMSAISESSGLEVVMLPANTIYSLSLALLRAVRPAGWSLCSPLPRSAPQCVHRQTQSRVLYQLNCNS